MHPPARRQAILAASLAAAVGGGLALVSLRPPAGEDPGTQRGDALPASDPILLVPPEAASAPQNQQAETPVAFSPDGALLASATHDGTVYVWDIAAARPRTKLYAPDEWIQSLAFSPDGTRLAAGSSDSARVHRTHIWSLTDYQPATTFSGRGGGTQVAFLPDGRTLVVSNPGLVLVDTSRHEVVRSLDDWDKGSYVSSIAMSSDGARIATSGTTGNTGWNPGTTVWDVATGRPLRSRAARAWWRDYPAAFSPAGDVLAVAGGLGFVELWDLAGNGEPRRFPSHAPWISALAFAPDGSAIAVAGLDSSTVRLYDPASGRERFRLPVPVRASATYGSAGLSLAFSPDGACLAIGGPPNRVLVVRTHDLPRPPAPGPAPEGSDIRRNESSVIGSLKNLVTAEEQFKTPGNKPYATLTWLSDTVPPYIDGELGAGAKSGYSFVLANSEPMDANYYVQADPIVPGRTGRRHFFVDSSGVIRSHPSRAATSGDSPIE